MYPEEVRSKTLIALAQKKNFIKSRCAYLVTDELANALNKQAQQGQQQHEQKNSVNVKRGREAQEESFADGEDDDHLGMAGLVLFFS